MTTDVDKPARRIAISKLVEVIRTWFLPIAYDLCLDPLPKIALKNARVHDVFGFHGAGHYDPNTDTVVLAVPAHPVHDDNQYLLTLAHEMRHAWQSRYQVAPTEKDCETFAHEFLERSRRGETMTYRFTGSIAGLIVLRPCQFCGTKTEAEVCRNCARTAEPVRFEKPSVRIEAHEAKKSIADRLRESRRNKSAAKLRKAQEEILRHKMDYIDNHPANGRIGWWRVEGEFYCHASSAAEAVMKVADKIGRETPLVEYIGEKLPFKT